MSHGERDYGIETSCTVQCTHIQFIQHLLGVFIKLHDAERPSKELFLDALLQFLVLRLLKTNEMMTEMREVT